MKGQREAGEPSRPWRCSDRQRCLVLQQQVRLTKGGNQPSTNMWTTLTRPLRAPAALQESRPEVVAGSVDDRLQVMVHGHQLGQRTAAGLRLHRQRLPQHHFQALSEEKAAARGDVQEISDFSLVPVPKTIRARGRIKEFQVEISRIFNVKI